jgi:D-aminopeptidase
VAGVEVGHVTLTEGTARTGVTAIFPRGRTCLITVPAASFSLNGNGEMTGTLWVEESGLLEGPVMLTNTHSVGVVRDAVVEWSLPKVDPTVKLPLVAETNDGHLNDIDAFHVTKEHAFEALDEARIGPVPEGNVGGGTGMMAHGFKGGIGTASRQVDSYTVGVLVQANYGQRDDLCIAGIPVGKEMSDLQAILKHTPESDGSSISVVATDAPLLPFQLKAIAKRAALGLARNGGMAYHSSGDIFVAFSTATVETDSSGIDYWRALPNHKINPLFRATVYATEEAIINALVAAETMTGIDGNTVYALPHDRLQAILTKYSRLHAT